MQRKYIYIFLFLVAALILPFVQAPKPVKDLLYKSYNFALFVYIIYVLVAPKMRHFFIQRRERIEKEIAEAQQEKERAEKLFMLHQEKVIALEQKEEEVLERFRQEGNREKEKIIEEAKREAQRIITNARDMILREVKTYRQKLKQETIKNSLQMASGLIGQQYRQEDQQRMIEEALTKVKDIQQ